jgi:hypothetical protein
MKKLFLILPLHLLVCHVAMAGADSLKKAVPIIQAWTLAEGYNRIQQVDIDTALTGIQVVNPLFRRSLSVSYLGNTGLAAISHIFSERAINPEFVFGTPYQYYFHSPQSIRFYNTRRPFTRVGFTTAGPQKKNEKILSILHTQNVSPDFNLGFLYDNIGAEGQYRNQNAKTNALSLFSNLKKKNYLFHAHFNLNLAQVIENGGLQDPADLLRTDLGTEDLTVNLNNARNDLRNFSLFFIQKYRLFGRSDSASAEPELDAITLPGLRIGHMFHFNRFKRLFANSNPDPTLFPESFIDPSVTRDSAFYRNLRNDLFIEIPELRIRSFGFGADAGITQELVSTGYSIVPDTLVRFNDGLPRDTIVTTFRKKPLTNHSLFGRAHTVLTDRIALNGSVRYFFAGDRQNDFEFEAKGTFRIPLFSKEVLIEPEVSQVFYTPSYFLRNYESNHFVWNNSFRQMQRSSVGGTLTIPELAFRTGIRFDLLNHFIYFSSAARPEQLNDVFEYFMVFLEKDFRLGGLLMKNRFVYQNSRDNGLIHVPDLAAYISLSYTQTIIKDVLTAQAGIDLHYNTEFFIPAYQPATGQFYPQSVRKYGNYPYLDGFLNLSIKRTRIFLKAEHFNSGFSGRDYFTVFGYPRNQFMMRFGLIWTFYD